VLNRPTVFFREDADYDRNRAGGRALLKIVRLSR
jgi:hypothetical protein